MDSWLAVWLKVSLKAIGNRWKHDWSVATRVRDQPRPWLERSDPNPRKVETAVWGYATEKKGNSKGWLGIRLGKNHLSLSSDYWAQYQSTEISEVYLRAFLESWTSRLQDTPILNNRIMGTSVHLGCHRRARLQDTPILNNRIIGTSVHLGCHRRGRGCTEVPIILLFKIGVSWSLEVHDSKNALR